MLVDILVALLFCDSFMFLGIVVDEKKELKFFSLLCSLLWNFSGEEKTRVRKVLQSSPHVLTCF